MIKKLLSSRLRINMVSGVATHGINFIVLAVAYPVYLHYLGYDTYGLWLALGTVLAFAQLGELGISQAVMKLVAEEHGRGDIKAIERLVTTAITILLISGSVTLGIILFFKTSIIGLFRFNEENAQLAAWLLPYIGVLSVYVLAIQALNATLSGLGRMDLGNYVQTGGRVVALGVATVLLLVGHGIGSLLIGGIASYIVIHAVSLFFIHRVASVRFLRAGNLSFSTAKRILRFSMGIFGGSLIGMLLDPFNKCMLSRYAGAASIPIYDIAFRGSKQIRAFCEVALRATMPEISRLSATTAAQARERITCVFHKAMKLSFFWGGPFYLFFLPFASPLLRLWLGEEFNPSIPTAFRIVLIGTFFSILAVPSYYLFIGLGKVVYAFLTHLITSLSNMFIVSIIVVCSGNLTTTQVALSVCLSWLLSSLFIIFKANHVWQHQENETSQDNILHARDSRRNSL